MPYSPTKGLLDTAFQAIENSLSHFEPQLTDKENLRAYLRQQQAEINTWYAMSEQAFKRAKGCIYTAEVFILVWLAVTLGGSTSSTLSALFGGLVAYCAIRFMDHMSDAKLHDSTYRLYLSRCEILHRALDAGDREADAFLHGFLKFKETQVRVALPEL